MISVPSILAIWNHKCSSVILAALAKGSRRPSQLEKGPMPIMERESVSHSWRIWLAARSWLLGVGPPGKEEAR